MKPALKNYRGIFFGSAPFSLPILQSLLTAGWQIAAVVTQPDRPSGRALKLAPTPVKKFATQKKLAIYDWASLKDESIAKQIRELAPDFAIVAAYGQIIPPAILKTARKGFLNLHPSLLPKYRGPSPIQFALLNGEAKTGVSIIMLDSQMDHGPILAQVEVPITPAEDYQSLHDRLAKISGELLCEVLPDWILGRLDTHRQDDRRATYTKLLRRDDGRINWKNTAEGILRQIRAYTPWPGTWATLSGKRIKILRATAIQASSRLDPGQLSTVDSKLLVACGNGTSLQIKTLQTEGGKVMTSAEFVSGKPDLSGKRFDL